MELQIKLFVEEIYNKLHFISVNNLWISVACAETEMKDHLLGNYLTLNFSPYDTYPIVVVGFLKKKIPYKSLENTLSPLQMFSIL